MMQSMTFVPVNRRWMLALATLIATLVGCASDPATAGARAPVVTIAQLSVAEPMRAAMETRVPVDYRLEVTNPFDHPVTLLAVEIETVGDTGGYALKRVRHTFGQSIDAHATATIDLRAWVQPLQVTDTDRIVSSVMLRGSAKFDSMGSKLQSTFASRIAQ